MAGPITGRNLEEANDWRGNVVEHLNNAGIRGVSPLRCEPIRGETYDIGNADPRFGTARAIASKNFLDVQTCDITLVYLPKELNDKKLSLGTIVELAWAHALRKPTILVSDDPLITEHPVMQANASWVVPSLDEAIEVIVGVLDVYK